MSDQNGIFETHLTYGQHNKGLTSYTLNVPEQGIAECWLLLVVRVEHLIDITVPDGFEDIYHGQTRALGASETDYDDLSTINFNVYLKKRSGENDVTVKFSAPTQRLGVNLLAINGVWDKPDVLGNSLQDVTQDDEGMYRSFDRVTVPTHTENVGTLSIALETQLWSGQYGWRYGFYLPRHINTPSNEYTYSGENKLSVKDGWFPHTTSKTTQTNYIGILSRIREEGFQPDGNFYIQGTQKRKGTNTYYTKESKIACCYLTFKKPAGAIIGSGSLLQLGFKSTMADIKGSGQVCGLAFLNAPFQRGALLRLAFYNDVHNVGSGSLLRLGFKYSAKYKGRLLGLSFSSYTMPVEKERTHFTGDGTIGLNKLGYNVSCRIDGRDINVCDLTDQIVVQHEENGAYMLDFTLYKEHKGVEIDLFAWHSKPIELDIRTKQTTKRLFSGYVDVISIDPITDRYMVSCTDRRKLKVNQLPHNIIESIGYTSKAAHGDVFKDNYDELTRRLETVPYSFEYDAWGNWYLTEWTPKWYPDINIGCSNIFKNSPKLTTTASARVLNRVSITLQHQFTREVQRELSCNFTDTLHRTACDYSKYFYPPTTESVRQVIQSSGWVLKSPSLFSFDGLPPAGNYNCWSDRWKQNIVHIWSPIQITTEVEYETDSKGNKILDANGNPKIRSRKVFKKDMTYDYCSAANWIVAKRYLANVSEEVKIDVRSDSSIALYQELKEEMSYNIKVDYNKGDQDWAGGYQGGSAPAGFKDARTKAENSNTVGGTWQYGEYYYDYDNKGRDYNATCLVAIATAYTKILSSHRQNEAVIQAFFYPDCDLRQTHAVNTPNFTGNFKVFGFKHTLNVETRSAETEITYKFIHSNDPVNSGMTPVNVVYRPNSSPNYRYKSRYTWRSNLYPQFTTTEDISSGKYSQDEGFFAKYADGDWSGFKYSMGFRIRMPDIEKAATDNRLVSSNETYKVNIPNSNVKIFI